MPFLKGLCRYFSSDNFPFPISLRKGFLCLLLAVGLDAQLMHQEVQGASNEAEDLAKIQKCDRRIEGTWTWIDKSGNLRAHADLQAILNEHKKWIRTSQREGRQADLSGTKLTNVEIRDTDMIKANFSKSDLSYADFRRTNLGEAVLRGANLTCARLEGAQLHGVDLTEMDLSSTTLSDAELGSATLVRATLKGSVLRGVKFNTANMNEANLTGADLTNVQFGDTDLRDANLRNAMLVNAYLGSANLEGADLFGATYEVNTDPSPKSIAVAKNIEYMTHRRDSASLARCRSLFKETGFRDQERKITYALKSRQGELLWEACANEKGNCFEYWVNRILFDLTSQYGMNPGRVFIIVLVVFSGSTGAYWRMIHRSKDSGLSIIVPADRDRQNQPLWLLANLNKAAEKIEEGGWVTKKEYKIEPNGLGPLSGLGYYKALIRREWVLFRVSCLFSLMSTFNIKFRDVDFGRWLRQLMTKEYDIKATGWARTVS